MDALNRLLASILGLLLGAAGVMGILATAGVFDAQGFVDGVLAEAITRMSDSSDTTMVLLYAISSLLLLLGLVILALEIAQMIVTRDMVTIADDRSGTTQVAVDSIERLCEKVALSNRDVTSCDCAVSTPPEGLTINCKTQLKLGADVPAVTSNLQASIRDAVETLLGLPVANIYIDARYGRRPERSLVAG